MLYQGYIKGYHVVFERRYAPWDEEYLQETVDQLHYCLIDLPDTVTKEEFIKGMLKVTGGKINPKLAAQVYEDVRG